MTQPQISIQTGATSPRPPTAVNP